MEKNEAVGNERDARRELDCPGLAKKFCNPRIDPGFACTGSVSRPNRRQATDAVGTLPAGRMS